MNYESVTYLFPYFVSLLISCGVGIIAYRRRSTPGVTFFVLMISSQALWTAGYIAELLAPTLGAKIFWDNVESIGTAGWAMSALGFTVQYTERKNSLNQFLLVSTFFLALLYALLHFTDSYHGLIRTGSRLVSGDPFDALDYEFGFLTWVFIGYFLLLFFIGISYLIGEFFNPHRIYYGQLVTITFGLFIPIAGMIMAIAGIKFTFHRDTSPFYFAISSIIIAFGLFRFRLFDVVPVGRKTVLENIHDAVLVMDETDRIVELNPAGGLMLGDQPGALIGRHIESAFSKWPHIVSVYKNNEKAQTEIEMKTGDEQRFVDLSVLPLYDKSRSLKGKLMVIRDITDRRLAEDALRAAHGHLEHKVKERTEELERVNEKLRREIINKERAEKTIRENEEKYRLLAENATDVIWTMDLGLNITYVSPSVYDLRGFTPEEAVKHKLPELMSPESVSRLMDRVAEDLKRIRETGQKSPEPEVLEIELYRKDGSTVITETTASFVLDDDGRPYAILGVTRDISERKGLEDQLVQAQKMEAIGRLAGGVAHDFNNQLMVIMNVNSMVGKIIPEDNERAKKMLDISVKASEKARALTAQLLAFSRKQVVEPAVLDLNQVLEDIKKLLGRMIGEDVKVTYKLSPDLGYVLIDPVQIEQVIMNLSVNARDAMPEGGSLVFETGNVRLDPNGLDPRLEIKPGNYVMLAVSDNGEGMDKATLEHIFEPFYTTKKKGEGTGLGLAMVYGIVKQAGGAVHVYSEPGRGTTFKIYLERVDEDAKKQEKKETEKAQGGHECILLVEDEELVRDSTTAFLADYGYNVIKAESGEEAVEIFNEKCSSIKIVITDVIMTGMNGAELADKIKRLDPDSRILFMSGYTDNIIARHGVLEKGVDFIQKPFTTEEMLKKVRKILDR